MIIYPEVTGQRGSARFANREDYGDFNDAIDFYQHFLLGKSIRELTEGLQKDMVVEVPGHCLLFGGSGAGKSLWLKLNIIARLVSFCAIDLKAELYDATAPFLQANGFEIIRIDPFQHWETKYGLDSNSIQDTPCSYNPLKRLTPDSLYYSDDILAITEALIPIGIHESPYWSVSARSIVESLIAYVVETPYEQATLGRVRELFCGGLSVLIALAEQVVKDTENVYRIDSLAKKKLMQFVGLTPDNKNLASVYSTADTHLKFLDSMPISQALARSDFDFDTLLDQNQKIAIFIILPPKRIETHSKFLRLMISEMINTFSSYGGNPRRPVDLFIDEAATVGYLSVLPMAYSYMRGEGLRITCIYQSIGQLETLYGQDAEVFSDNSSATIMLKASSLKSSEYFSKTLGYTTIVEEYGQENPQKIGDLPYMLDHKVQQFGNLPSYRPLACPTYSRALMTSDELKLLPDDLGIVITNGRPALFRKINVHTEQPYCNALRQNPFHN